MPLRPAEFARILRRTGTPLPPAGESVERRALGEIPADRGTGSAGGVDYLFGFEKLFVEKCRDRVLPPRLAGAGQFVGQIAAFEVEDAVGQRAAPSRSTSGQTQPVKVAMSVTARETT